MAMVPYGSPIGSSAREAESRPRPVVVPAGMAVIRQH